MMGVVVHVEVRLTSFFQKKKKSGEIFSWVILIQSGGVLGCVCFCVCVSQMYLPPKLVGNVDWDGYWYFSILNIRELKMQL